MNNPPKIIFLLGMPGVGKSYYGKMAALQLGKSFIDLDAEITMLCRQTISEIFETKGETEFRKIERQTLENIVKQSKVDSIIATGGGTPCFNNTMKWMNEMGMTVWLDAEISHLYNNLTQDNQIRPLFDTHKREELMHKLSEMYQLRIKYYEQSRVKVSIYRGLSANLFTKRLHLSTFAK